jgi:dihydrofolate reductase
MGRVVVSEFMSLDGVIEDPGGSEGAPGGGWAFRFDRGPEGDKFKLDEVLEAEAMLLGRVTYQGFAQAWPSRTDDVGFADKMNSMPKYVVSTTLETAEWRNSTVIAGDVAAEVAKLREQLGGDIMVAGSAQLVDTLRQHDLVDEYRLMLYPVVLGSGKRLFPDGSGMTSLRLVETRPAGSVVILTLHPVRPGEDASQHSAAATR